MDAKVFRMAILTIISAFILVLVIVYATNAESINKLLGWEQKSEEAADTAVSSSSDTVYGEQIGDDLNAFLYEEDFFDETEEIPSVVVIKKNSGSSDSSDEAGSFDSSPEGDAPDDEGGSGMAVVGELTNPNGVSNPGAFDSNLFEYNGVMPTTPPQGAGTPVGSAVGN